MPLAQFLTSLFEDGRVVVPQLRPLTEEELVRADEVLVSYERIQRDVFPGTPPQFHLSAGRWAAIQLFRACQFAIFRDLGVAEIDEELGRPFPEAKTPAAHYSVDLTFRVLPDLWRHSQAAAEQDPLLAVLVRWAREWPLASVGIVSAEIVSIGFTPTANAITTNAMATPVPGETTTLEPLSIDEFACDASLMQFYVDRIIATGDRSRLGDIRVQKSVAAALGNYPSLHPKMHQALLEIDAPEPN